VGLSKCAFLIKRAIQFGSRIAQSTSRREFGSHAKGKGQRQYNL
jgi:hypothetical protein